MRYTKDQLREELKLKKLLRINGYIKEAGSNGRITSGSSNITLSLDYDYIELLKESKKILMNGISLQKIHDLSKEFTVEKTEITLVINELKDSIGKTLLNESTGAVKEIVHEPIAHGVKYNAILDTYYFTGLKIREDVLVEPKYKEVKSKPKTLVKEAIKNLLPHSKLHVWKLTSDSLYKLQLLS